MSYGRYQTGWRRFFASIIDGIVFMPIDLAIDWLQESQQSPEFRLVLQITGGILFLSYSILLHWRFGQTVGKMVMKVKVLDIGEGRRPTFRQAMIRDIGGLVSMALGTVLLVVMNALPSWEILWIPTMILLGGSLLWSFLEIVTMLADDKRRALHDHIAGTVVVRWGS